MSADFIILFIVLFITTFTIVKRISSQVVILVLMSSLLVSISFGSDIISFLSGYNELFDTKNMRLTVYLAIVMVPTLFTYWHLRGGADYNPLERFLVAVFLSLLILISVTSVFEIAGFDSPLGNSYFANQIYEFEGFIALAAFASALFEILNQNNPMRIKARRGRRKLFSKKK